MATLIASVSARSDDGGGFDSLPINTTGADLLVLILSSDGSVALPSIVDSKGNTWIGCTERDEGTDLRCRIYYVRGGTVGSGHTFSANGPAKLASIAVLAFAGSVASPLDQQNGAAATSVSSKQPGSVTPTQDGEVIIFGASTQALGVSATVNSGMTLGPANVAENNSPSPGMCRGVASAWLEQGAAAAINPAFAFSGATNVAVAIATFKFAAAPAGSNLLMMF